MSAREFEFKIRNRFRNFPEIKIQFWHIRGKHYACFPFADTDITTITGNESSRLITVNWGCDHAAQTLI